MVFIFPIQGYPTLVVPTCMHAYVACANLSTYADPPVLRIWSCGSTGVVDLISMPCWELSLRTPDLSLRHATQPRGCSDQWRTSNASTAYPIQWKGPHQGEGPMPGHRMSGAACHHSGAEFRLALFGIPSHCRVQHLITFFGAKSLLVILLTILPNPLRPEMACRRQRSPSVGELDLVLSEDAHARGTSEFGPRRIPERGFPVHGGPVKESSQKSSSSQISMVKQWLALSRGNSQEHHEIGHTDIGTECLPGQGVHGQETKPCEHLGADEPADTSLTEARDTPRVSLRCSPDRLRQTAGRHKVASPQRANAGSPSPGADPHLSTSESPEVNLRRRRPVRGLVQPVQSDIGRGRCLDMTSEEKRLW